MPYKRLPKPHDRLRSQINWNTCILLVAVSIVIPIIVLIELHIRRVTVHSGFPGCAISLRAEHHHDDMLGVEGFAQLVLDSAKLPLPEMRQAVLDGVAAWRHGTLADDVSLVIVEVR